MSAIDVVIKRKIPKGAPRSKRPGANDSPARQLYWRSKRLMHRKIRNLMRCNGLTLAEATNLWLTARTKRRRLL